MAPESEIEPVEIVERITIEPAAEDEETIDDGAAEEAATGEEGEPEGGGPKPKEQLVRRQSNTTTETKPAVIEPKEPTDGLTADDLAVVESETPRERALRLEVTRLKALGRKDRGNELLGTEPAPAQKKEMSPEKAAILKKYKPGEIDAIREVLPILADDMGYVKSDDLLAKSYNDKASSQLETFLEKHPEYLPENDKGNLLWGRFQEEFKMYRQPQDPKDFRRIFNRVHGDIMGIKVAGEGKTVVEAQVRKVQSASHAGASATTRPTNFQRSTSNTGGMRLDMLKGFTPEEISELKGE